MMPNEDSGLDDSLYADEPAEKAKPDSVDEEAAENPTALLPLSAFGGKAKAGDTVTMRIVKVHGSDEVEVEISESVEEESEMDTDDEELKQLEEMEV